MPGSSRRDVKTNGMLENNWKIHYKALDGGRMVVCRLHRAQTLDRRIVFEHRKTPMSFHFLACTLRWRWILPCGATRMPYTLDTTASAQRSNDSLRIYSARQMSRIWVSGISGSFYEKSWVKNYANSRREMRITNREVHGGRQVRICKNALHLKIVTPHPASYPSLKLANSIDVHPDTQWIMTSCTELVRYCIVF